MSTKVSWANLANRIDSNDQSQVRGKQNSNGY